MNVSARSVLMSGLAAATAGAIAIAPSVTPASAPAASTVQLAAQTRNMVDRPDLSALVAAAQQRSPNAIVAVPAAAPAAPSLAAFPGIGNAIIDIYNAVEFWVSYGVDLADYVLGFIPYGYLIGDQISIFYYQLIEPIARSITYNIANFIGGSVSFVQGVTNVINDSIGAGINFGIAEFNYFFGWLIPPIPLSSAAVQEEPTFEVTAKESSPITPGVDTAQQGATGVLTEAVGELTNVVTQEKTVPEAVADGVDGISETVKEAVEDTASAVGQFNAGNARVTRSLVAAPGTVVKGAVRAQGEVRGAITDAATAVADAAAPETVAKGVRDGGRRVAGSIQKAADDVRTAVRSAHDTTGESETGD